MIMHAFCTQAFLSLCLPKLMSCINSVTRRSQCRCYPTLSVQGSGLVHCQGVYLHGTFILGLVCVCVCVSRLGFWCLLFEPSSHLWSHTERGSRFGDNKTDNDNSNNNHHHHNYRNNNAIQTIHIHGSVHNKNSLRRVVVTMLRQCEREKSSNNKTNNGLVVVVLPAKCVLETSHA